MKKLITLTALFALTSGSLFALQRSIRASPVIIVPLSPNVPLSPLEQVEEKAHLLLYRAGMATEVADKCNLKKAMSKQEKIAYYHCARINVYSYLMELKRAYNKLGDVLKKL